MKPADALRLFSPFRDLEPTYLAKLAEHSTISEVPKGKLLFKRGKGHAHRFYLIAGSVDLIDANFEHHRVNAGEERAGRALNDLSPSQVSAVTLETVSLLSVEADFLDLAVFWDQSAPGVTLTEPVIEDEPKGLSRFSLPEAKPQEEPASDWMSALIASPLFTKIPPAHIQTLFTRFESIPCHAGRVVIREGESGDYFYVIHKGVAQVTNLTGKLDVILSAGHFFGEEALVADAPRNATVTMQTDGILMRLRKEDFVELLQNPVQKNISPEQLHGHQDTFQIIDVRLPMEFRGGHIPGSRNIALSILRERLAELDPQGLFAVADNAGRRAQLAAYLMSQAGLDTYILEGAESLYLAQE